MAAFPFAVPFTVFRPPCGGQVDLPLRSAPPHSGAGGHVDAPRVFEMLPRPNARGHSIFYEERWKRSPHMAVTREI